ncbi:hypothetical protein, partial [Komagataeibacter europaeus]|uniref:hypothetical protein n=1 Tax=Komagataeibacter europaeus TaxID=33995 RepID=UPI00223245E1
ILPPQSSIRVNSQQALKKLHQRLFHGWQVPQSLSAGMMATGRASGNKKAARTAPDRPWRIVP